MLQKMRMLFALFLTLPLILSLSLEPGYAETIDNDKIIEDILGKVEAFKSKKKEEKDKILKELDGSISDLNKEIKNYISEKKENPNGKIIVLLKKMLEMNLYIKNKVCNQEDKSCIDANKSLMNNIIAGVEIIFGKCEVAIEHITKLTSNTWANLNLVSFVIQSIADNSDFLELNQKQIIFDVVYCLEKNINGYWPAVVAQFGGKPETVASFKEALKKSLLLAYFKLIGYEPKEEDFESDDLLLNRRREKVFGEIIDILKEIKESKKDKTLVIIISCLATMTILIGGFLLYRFIRRKNSNLIETTKDLVASENKVSK